MNLPISDDVPPTDLVPVTQAAKLASCHVATLYRWIARGSLRAWHRGGKGGRVYVSEAEIPAMFQPVKVRRQQVERKKVTTPAAILAQRRRDAAELDRMGI